MKNLLMELLLLALIVMIAFMIKRRLRGRPEQAAELPFKAIAVLLLLMEAVKQLYYLCVGYDLYYIPLQICSLFLICYPLAAFAKGRLKNCALCMSLCLGCAASFAQIFLSQILTRDYLFRLFTAEATLFHYHTVLYHHVVVLHFVLMVILRPYTPDKRDISPTVTAYAVFMLLSCAGANLLQANYSGFLNYGAPAFDDFKKYGQAVFNLVGFSLNAAEYLLGVWVCFSVYALGRRRRKKKCVVEQE